MLKRRKIGMCFLGLLLIAVVSVLVFRSREPRYHGRTLSSWLQQYSDASLYRVERRSEAESAVRAIGADKALPYLLHMAKAKEGAIRSWIRQNQGWNFRFLKLKDPASTQRLGVAGFEILSTNCASAVPQLSLLMQDTNYAFTALWCLVGIGTPAEVPICQALTNQNPRVRSFAASQVSWVLDDLDVCLLNGPLNDADATVRLVAVQALGLHAVRVVGLRKRDPQEVIALLLRCMKDSDQNFAGYAVMFLGQLGTNAVCAIPELIEEIENGSDRLASESARSIEAIDPGNKQALTAWALRSFPSATTQTVDEWVKRVRPVTRPVFALGGPSDPQLQSFMNGEDPYRAVYAFADLRSFCTNSVPLISSALTNRHAIVRSEAVRVFGEGRESWIREGRRLVRPQIVRLLDDPCEPVRRAATNALRQIDSEEAVLPSVK